MCMKLIGIIILMAVGTVTFAQSSEVWVADLGNGQYKNPILHADYSDPDICQVGDDFYMTASSFNAVPGLPILHSRDLVNWKLIGHALPRQIPVEHFSTPQHGNGVWAPAIRYHQGDFYIYYGDPDFGIYMLKATDPSGPWSEPVLVQEGKGLIDPCPLWDEDGRAYLVHAFAGSRAGIKSILVVKEMNPEGTKVLNAGSIVFDGHLAHPTVEGAKFYKRNGYYYIFAPAGGVATGWQLALRSKDIYGPYEKRIVMAQGSTAINGPHQGGWVELGSGESWFVHFQDKGPYGRVVHLQPMVWENDWPVIGQDSDKDGTGEPVTVWEKPRTTKSTAVITPPDTDEFDQPQLGLQWQWHANSLATWAFANSQQGALRLYAHQPPADAKNLWDIPNLLLQKFPSEAFTVTTRVTFFPNKDMVNERTGLLVMGLDYAHLSLVSKADGLYLAMAKAKDAHQGTTEQESILTKISDNTVYLRVRVDAKASCRFSYSLDGVAYEEVDMPFTAREGRWIGAKVGLFATRLGQTNDSGYADYDWFRVTRE